MVLFLLILATLALSNSPWGAPLRDVWALPTGLQAGQYSWSRPLKNWINDGLLTLFFFVVALELKRELVTGELRGLRMAALSISAACGGMMVPALLYLAMRWGAPGQTGWAVAMSTDTALVIGALALLGKRVPLSVRVFLLSLIVLDDIGAILIVAVVYSSHLVPAALGAGALVMLVAGILSWLGMRSAVAYTLLGASAWVAIDASGIHATITGVLFGMLTPVRRSISNQLLGDMTNGLSAFLRGSRASDEQESRSRLHTTEIAIRENTAPAERLEFLLHPWVSFVVMPLFALANAGVMLSMDKLDNPVTLAVLISLVVGKPAGILVFSWIAVQLRLAERPPDLGWGVLTACGVLAGTGFTMSLLIADLALEQPLLDAARLGILIGSSLATVLGVALLAMLLPPTPNARNAIGGDTRDKSA